MTTCQNCKHEFDPGKVPEQSFFVIKCPKCGMELDQDGKLTKDALEKMCKKCGVCCHAKLKKGDTIYIFLSNPCPYVTEENKCSVYPSRHEKRPDCLNLEDAIKHEILPDCCGYRSLFPKDYHYPVLVRNLRDFVRWRFLARN